MRRIGEDIGGAPGDFSRAWTVRDDRFQGTLSATAHSRIAPVKLSDVGCQATSSGQIVRRDTVIRSRSPHRRKRDGHRISPDHWRNAMPASRGAGDDYGLPFSVVSLMLFPVS